MIQNAGAARLCLAARPRLDDGGDEVKGYRRQHRSQIHSPPREARREGGLRRRGEEADVPGGVQGQG